VSLTNELKILDRYPFHMPGHKRNPKFNIIGSNIDITEIDGFDNLHDANGIILDVEKRLSKMYKSKKSFMLVNGSTVGILSSIFALCNEGDKIVIARNCHKSVYNACMLRKLKVVYVEPEFDYVNGYYTYVVQNTLNDVLKDNPDAKAVVITSPTYEGNISNIKCDLPLIIDAAHGAHFGISSFPSYPVGDVVISSLHKTLPSLTQTAVANVYNEEYISKIKFYLDIFESSSPSYVLMSSVDKCCEFVENNKSDFDEYVSNLWDFRDIEFHNLRLKYSDDISKIVISTANTNISGVELAQTLRSDYKIEVEMASKSYVILMSSVGDSKEAFDLLKKALIKIDGKLLSKSQDLCSKPPVLNDEFVIDISDKSEAVEFKHSVGRLANEFVFAYPPDIPIIVPNEKITKDTVNYIIDMQKNGVNIVSDSGLLPNKLLTKPLI
jgi:arginine/lysine/ornithine decarboxylase